MTTKPKYISTEQARMTAFTLAILEYYCWRKSRSKSQIFRALLAAFPRVDPEFDFDEFEWFVKHMVLPELKQHSEVTAELKAELKRFRERAYTKHTSLFFEPDAPEPLTATTKRRLARFNKKAAAIERKQKLTEKLASLAQRTTKRKAKAAK